MMPIDIPAILERSKGRAEESVRALTKQDIHLDTSLRVQEGDVVHHFTATVHMLIEMPLQMAQRFSAKDPERAKDYLSRRLEEYRVESHKPNFAAKLAAEILMEELQAVDFELDTLPIRKRFSDFSPEERHDAKQAGLNALERFRHGLTDAEIQADAYLFKYYVDTPERSARENAVHQLRENKILYLAAVNERSASFDSALERWQSHSQSANLPRLEREPLLIMLNAYFEKLGLDPQALLAEKGREKS